MRSFRKGFTLIEVLLFLAISGVLMVGIIVGSTNAINQQRYSDSIQNFAEFLRGIYTDVSNPKGLSPGANGGRSEKAIYGKLVTFGEKTDNPDQKIFTYNVVGNISDNRISGDVLKTLSELKADVIQKDPISGLTTLYGGQGSYALNWDAKVQNANKDPFVGALLIVRSPSSGTVYTYTLSGTTVEVNRTVKEKGASALSPLLNSFSNSATLDFCIAPEGITLYNGKRQDVRIAPNAHNSSSIELIDLDSSENICAK